MPTKPIDNVLPRKQEDNIQQVLNKLSDHLAEVVNFGTHVFQWYNETCIGKTDEASPPSLLFRHFLGIIDASSELIRSSIIEPIPVYLRSALETVLALKWILQGDSERRAMAFLVWNVHQKLKLYSKLDPNTQQGKEFVVKLEGSLLDGIQFPPINNLLSARQNLENLLHNPIYKDATAEYERLRRSGVKNPAWHELFGGPKNIEQLASRVNMSEFYEVLYRKWSGITHGTDVMKGIRLEPNGETYFLSLRHPVGVEEMYIFAVGLALHIYRRLMEVYHPSKVTDMNNWYIREVQSIFKEVSSKKIIVEGNV